MIFKDIRITAKNLFLIFSVIFGSFLFSIGFINRLLPLIKPLYSFRLMMFFVFLFFTLIILLFFILYRKNKYFGIETINKRDRIPIFLSLLIFTVMGVIIWKYHLFNLIQMPYESYELEIYAIPEEKNQQKTICLIEIKDTNGLPVPITELKIDDNWISTDECLLMTGAEQGTSIKYSSVGRVGEYIEVLFGGSVDSGDALIILNGNETIADLSNEGTSEKIVLLDLSLFKKHLILIGDIFTFFACIYLIFFTILLSTRQIKWIRWIINQYELILIILCILLFRVRGTIVYQDSMTYLTWAKNIYQGLGFIDLSWQPVTFRGPVYPAVIALFFRFFGSTVASGVITTRFFWILSVLISYLLGRVLFNRPVGFITSLLIISSGVIQSIFSSILTDGPAIFFVISTQLIIFLAFEKADVRLFIFSGLLLGIAYLTKQTSAFLFPLPILLWVLISDYRKKPYLKKIFLYVTSFSLVLLLWFSYISINNANPFRELGVASYLLFNKSIHPTIGSTQPLITRVGDIFINVFEYINTMKDVFIRFYVRDIKSHIVLAPLFIISYIYSIIDAIILKSKANIFLLCGICLFIPLIPSEVYYVFGVRHNLYLYIISYLLLGSFLFFISKWCVNIIERICKSQTHISSNLFIVFSLGLFFTTIQVTFGNHTIKTFFDINHRNWVFAPALFQNDFKITGHTEDINISNEYVIEWLEKNTNNQAGLLTDGKLGNGLYFNSSGFRPFTIINFNYSGEIDYSEQYIDSKKPILYLWTYHGIEDPGNIRGMLGAISEPQLINSIVKNNVQTILLTDYSKFMYSYFYAHPAFNEVKRFDELNVIIFEVENEVKPIKSYAEIDFCMHLGKGTLNYLQNMRLEQPEKHKNILNDYLKKYLGLSSLDIQNLELKDHLIFLSE